MNEYLGVVGAMLALGAVSIYYAHGQAYKKGIGDAVRMHHSGVLTYSEFEDENGEVLIDIHIAPEDE